ncbi:MAG: GH3 auxin-responsive promoter family protein [Bacteroidota bacterium]|nr:GH3 auxin-responsive promoter family protein [Bacteroidota bacterium]
MNKLLTYTIKSKVNKRIVDFQNSIEKPYESQELVLKSLIETAVKTKWGKIYDYKSISNSEIFSNRIAIQDYNSLKNLITLSLKGEKNVLWPGRIKWFAKSSGTTSDKSKFIPISKSSLEDCHYKAGKDLIAVHYNNYPDSKVSKGNGLALGGSHEINKSNKKSKIGDLSAILLQNLPLWSKLWQEPSTRTSLMSDWEQKIIHMTEEVMNKNITHISGVPTWTVVLINNILKVSQKEKITDLWPNLELYVHGGVSFEPYRKMFKELIPNPDMIYMETYNASEGFFGIQDQKNSKDLLLLIDHGIYYEFIPVNEIENETPKVLKLSEVELNKNYAIVISTNAGLWRYVIGDTLKFTSLKPFRFRLTGRTKNFINAFGEEVIIENAEKAISEACSVTNAEITDYTAAPIFFSNNNNGTHEWIIEFKKNPDNENLFKETLDKSLQNANSDYEAKRYKDIALSPPIIHFVPKGTFYNWMKKRGKLGGQHKVPRLFNSRKYVEDIKVLLGLK